MRELQVRMVTVHGNVAPDVQDYARHKIGQLARLAPGPVLLARITFERAPDPAVERPASVQATLDVSGRLVRGRAAARHFGEAIDMLEATLRYRLEHLASHLRDRRRRPPTGGPGEWRHGDSATSRPAWFPRPAEERAVVRHQRLTGEPKSVALAALDLDLLDEDFSLFVEAQTGRDALLWHRPEGDLGLAVAGGRLPDLAAGAVPVQTAPAPPTLTPEEATRRLDLTGERFAFFVDRLTGRGAVAYRQRDGHYGLISAVPERPAPAGR